LKKRKGCYKSKIELLSPAKINLYLNLLGRYRDGYHKIESIFERISLCDKIDIEVTNDPGIVIQSNRRDLQNENNLCCRAAALIKSELNIPFGFKIILKKNIPVGSGLGGGSSNAACVLLGIDALLDLKLSRQKLYRLGGKLGSDVNFFLSEASFALVSGRGEKIIPFNAKKFEHIIIWPRAGLATKKVYRHTQVKLTKFLSNVKILQYALRKGDVALVRQNIFNALEPSALALCAKLRRAKQYFDKKGILVKVTGSGSALYAILGYRADCLIDIDKIPKSWDVFKAWTF
jgi:4-diphosphocytidyl-2-C-methyl-D-erythritol kinase